MPYFFADLTIEGMNYYEKKLAGVCIGFRIVSILFEWKFADTNESTDTFRCLCWCSNDDFIKMDEKLTIDDVSKDTIMFQKVKKP